MPLRVNSDGSLPMWLDSDGRWKLAADVEDTLTAPGGAHDHDADYAAAAHVHAAGDHPDVTAHVTLGLASAHPHPYSLDSHAHPGIYSETAHDHAGAYADPAHVHVLTDGDIPAGIARDTEVSAAITAHLSAATHGGEASHPDLAAHDTLGLVTQTEMDAHQHDAEYAAAVHTHPGGSEAFPVGSVFISVVATNPGVLLGYGTWAAFGEGRVLLGVGGAFTQPEATGGTDTHTHAAHTGVIDHSHTVSVTDPGHAHVENSNNATTGPLRGWGAADTSTNTSTATGYSTAPATTGITAAADAPAGAVASLTHDSPSHLPPYITAYFWKRTA